MDDMDFVDWIGSAGVNEAFIREADDWSIHHKEPDGAVVRTFFWDDEIWAK